MNTSKFIIGGVIGGVLFFLLGWLIYGMLLMDFMMQHSNTSTGAFRAEADMIMWSMALGNLGLGFLLSYVCSKGNVNSVSAGAVTGLVTMLLVSLAYDFILYAQLTLWDTTALMVDIVTSAIIGAVVGAAIGWYNGRK